MNLPSIIDGYFKVLPRDQNKKTNVKEKKWTPQHEVES